MDNIVGRLYVGVFLLSFAAHYNCKVTHTEIFNTINAYANKSCVIDGFFKPERMIGEGHHGAVWKGINYFIFGKKKHIFIQP